MLIKKYQASVLSDREVSSDGIPIDDASDALGSRF